MMRKLQKIEIKKRGPRVALYSLCSPVHNNAEVHDLVLAMIHQLRDEGLDGLSANECGVNKQLFITDVPGDHIRIFINPVVTVVDHDMDEHLEVCASYDKARMRFRHNHVIVDATNFKGERFLVDTSSPVYPEDVGRRLAARIQHEMEHMFGMDIRDEPDVAAGQTALVDLLITPERRPD
jgi:peptide deformylase